MVYTGPCTKFLNHFFKLLNRKEQKLKTKALSVIFLKEDGKIPYRHFVKLLLSFACFYTLTLVKKLSIAVLTSSLFTLTEY